MREIEKGGSAVEIPERDAEPEPREAAPATKQTSVARSAGIVSIAVMFSRLLGLVREQVFAYYFGAGFIYDAYVVAFRIPNVLRDLFAEGALSVAFVMVFTDYQINKNAIPDLASQWAIIGMAIGTLIGGAAQFLMQVPWLFKIGFRFTPALSFADEGVRRVVALMTPAILGTSAVQINVLINTYFVSGIEGAQGWLSYAFRLMQFPIGLFGVAVGTAAIPVLSRLASEGKIKDFRDTVSSSMNLVFLMTLPSACGLIVLGEPIVRLIYERGKFDATATSMTAVALAGYSIGLTGYAAIKILSPAFYALSNAKTPMIIAIASIGVNFVGSYALREWFSHYGVTPETPYGYGHVGVALATSIVALVNFFALALMMRKRIKRLNGREILFSFLKIAAASAALSAVCYASYQYLFNRFGVGTFTIKLIEAFVPIALGGATFVIVAKLLRVAELERLYGMLRRKLGR